MTINFKIKRSYARNADLPLAISHSKSVCRIVRLNHKETEESRLADDRYHVNGNNSVRIRGFVNLRGSWSQRDCLAPFSSGGSRGPPIPLLLLSHVHAVPTSGTDVRAEGRDSKQPSLTYVPSSHQDKIGVDVRAATRWKIGM